MDFWSKITFPTAWDTPLNASNWNPEGLWRTFAREGCGVPIMVELFLRME